jgi:hypothetical protein
MALPSNYYGGSAVPQAQQMGANRTGGAYSGLGTGVQQFGQANPYGPFATLGGASGGDPKSSTGGTSSGADSAARQYLSGVVSGQNTPYNQTTRDSMYSQQSGMAANAEAGRNQQIAEQAAVGGASPSDPSYQRLIRQSMAARQSQNQQSMGDIDRTANLANQQTQQQAAGTLLGSEDERNALQQGYNQRATQMAMGYLYGNGGGQSSGGNNFQGSGFLQYGPQYGSQNDRELDAQKARTQQMLRS